MNLQTLILKAAPALTPEEMKAAQLILAYVQSLERLAATTEAVIPIPFASEGVRLRLAEDVTRVSIARIRSAAA